MSGRYAVFGFVIFDDPVYVKIFLGVCLLVLAVYLFFLQGKIYFLGLSLPRKYRSSSRITPLLSANGSFTAIDTNEKSAVDGSVVAEKTSNELSDICQPIMTNKRESVFPAELIHRSQVVDQIKNNYLGARKKLRLLRFLWIIIAILTAILMITFN